MTPKEKAKEMKTQQITDAVNEEKENEVLFDVVAMLPDEEVINKLSSKYMNSNRNIRGGDAGWIEAAYKDGMRDLINILKGN
jgi:hypothetical protein